MATSSSPTFAELRRQVKAGAPAPVYLLHGEEGFYIDVLVKDFEALLPEADRDFNLYTLYAPQTEAATVDSTCRRFPVMAQRQMVILKEAQAVDARWLSKLIPYIDAPASTTVLVICCRGKEAAAAVVKAVRKSGVCFDSKRPKNISTELAAVIKENNLNIEPKSLVMLTDYVGNDLSRLYNEVQKLAVALGPGAMITPEAIERNIGISKDYNNFELLDAIDSRNAAKAYAIAEYFRANPKNNPWVVTLSTIYNRFSNLLIYHFNRQKTPAEIAAAMGLRSEWALKSYATAAKNYNAFQTIEIIGAIREADCHSKGIGSRTDPYDALHDLIFRIFTASGRLPF